MKNAVQGMGDRDKEHEHQFLVQKRIRKLTGHEKTWPVHNGNSALLAVMSALEGPFLFPDQGAWIGLYKIAQFLNKEVFILPTDYGLIHPKSLNSYLEDKTPQAIFLTSMAGYTAEQPLKAIFDLCDEQDIMIIEDASGGLGDPEHRMGNGKYCHVMVASTGWPKMANVGQGGFISTKKDTALDIPKYLLKIIKADLITCAGMNIEFKYVSDNLKKTLNFCDYLKKELDNVFHQSKRGVNVIIPVNHPREIGAYLREKLKVQGGGMITLCPNPNRILTDAVAVEIKNLDVSCLTTENSDVILEILADSLKIRD